MSNTDMEIRTHRAAIQEAKGNVLVTGLGLGMYLTAILAKEEVNSVTVIEKSEDLIRLVSPHFIDDQRVTVICADAFYWKPPKDAHYDFVWHDIWPDICSDNLKEMTKLKRKFAQKADLQMCWAESECRRLR
jgi:spermidine synthase